MATEIMNKAFLTEMVKERSRLTLLLDILDARFDKAKCGHRQPDEDVADDEPTCGHKGKSDNPYCYSEDCPLQDDTVKV